MIIPVSKGEIYLGDCRESMRLMPEKSFDTCVISPPYFGLRDYGHDGLKYAPFWHGFIWMNPPFGGRNGLVPWLESFVAHGNGIALVPDRTSAPWWQWVSRRVDAILFVDGKIHFIDDAGIPGKSPAQGTCLLAIGPHALRALLSAERNGLGFVVGKYHE